MPATSAPWRSISPACSPTLTPDRVDGGPHGSPLHTARPERDHRTWQVFRRRSSSRGARRIEQADDRLPDHVGRGDLPRRDRRAPTPARLSPRCRRKALWPGVGRWAPSGASPSRTPRSPGKVCFACPRDVVGGIDLHIAGTRDLLGEITTVTDPTEPVVAGMDHQESALAVQRGWTGDRFALLATPPALSQGWPPDGLLGATR